MLCFVSDWSVRAARTTASAVECALESNSALGDCYSLPGQAGAWAT